MTVRHIVLHIWVCIVMNLKLTVEATLFVEVTATVVSNDFVEHRDKNHKIDHSQFS